jgi:hypothetical protein
VVGGNRLAHGRPPYPVDPRPVDGRRDGLRARGRRGFVALDGTSDTVIATIQAFAAGAILTMLADTMMPEAFENSGKWTGIVTVLGFTLATFRSLRKGG